MEKSPMEHFQRLRRAKPLRGFCLASSSSSSPLLEVVLLWANVVVMVAVADAVGFRRWSGVGGLVWLGRFDFGGRATQGVPASAP